MKLSVENKVALVTGGSRGIGAATVRLLVESGARVAFSYKSAKSKAEELVRACGPDKCYAVQSDLEGTEPARKLVENAVRHFGSLNILVANHGIWPPEDAAINEMSEKQWHGTIATNLDSVFSLIKQSVSQMKKQATASRPDASTAAGHIVLVSSTAGQRGEAFHCDYAASKGALISMTKGLSTELAPHRIYVNCVAPGWVATDMAAPALNDPATRETVLSKIPLGRVGKPEEIAGPIVFLCTPYAGFITGEIFNANGGAVLVG